MFAYVVPQDDQSFSRDYAGIFHFKSVNTKISRKKLYNCFTMTDISFLIKLNLNDLSAARLCDFRLRIGAFVILNSWSRLCWTGIKPGLLLTLLNQGSWIESFAFEMAFNTNSIQFQMLVQNIVRPVVNFEPYKAKRGFISDFGNTANGLMLSSTIIFQLRTENCFTWDQMILTSFGINAIKRSWSGLKNSWPPNWQNYWRVCVCNVMYRFPCYSQGSR